MMDDTPQTAPAWIWQAWRGPVAAATAAKLATDADPRAGASVPEPGLPPLPLDAPDDDDAEVVWGVLTRPDAPIPTPEGCRKLHATRAAAVLGVGA
jgi:hypothetical protein